MYNPEQNERMKIIPIKITKYIPSELGVEDYHRLNLVDLITKGYEYKGDPEYLLEQTKFEYEGEDYRVSDYIATVNEKAVGSLVVVHWYPTEPIRGEAFWNMLKYLNPKLAERALKYSPMAISFTGIVTLPEFRQQRIARRLIETSIHDLNPSIIVGQSKTVEAVVTRARVLSDFDYRTFYGNSEITTNNPQELTYLHQPVVEAFLAAHKTSLDSNGLIYSDTDLLVPSIPNVSGFPDYIQIVFADVIEAQKRVGDNKTVVKPLVSLKNQLLE